ncbi:hypothetical protein EJ08DRAFT_579606 [Tothia fuscella]|uniref:MARVEL domain-containing protein n=1 Tax=Tothia fuscella TaxID=1048955 RepID=A0A9P4P097_9PEZI|nr:hypothetical protein EJ08DRAFT_579606 [Tothia fuscella]
MANPIFLALRGIQFFCALIVMSLVGNMIALAVAGNPSIINFDMFVAVFAMLSLLYLVAATFVERLYHGKVVLGLEVLNVLFFFCGAVATASYLGVHSCGNTKYTHSNFITNGAANTHKRCTEAQASTAFLFFGFFAFLASLVLSFMHSMGGGSSAGSSFRRGPAMSQV